MKLSMETMYVPVANINQKREMISDWRATSDKVSKYSLVAALISVLATMSLNFFKNDFYFIFIGSGALFLLSALFCKKWYFSCHFKFYFFCCVRLDWFQILF